MCDGDVMYFTRVKGLERLKGCIDNGSSPRHVADDQCVGWRVNKLGDHVWVGVFTESFPGGRVQ